MGKCLFMRKGETHTVPGSGLPSGYTKLTYIQSSGEQYVDTGFVVNGNSHVVFDGLPSATGVLFGSRTSSSSNLFAVTYRSNGLFRMDYNASTYSVPSNYTGNVRRVFEINKGSMYIDGVLLNTVAQASFSSGVPLYLMALNAAGSASTICAGRIYSCQVYDNGTLVRDYIPCVNPSGEVGLYDTVTKAFFGNAGTGVFIGSEVS